MVISIAKKFGRRTRSLFVCVFYLIVFFYMGACSGTRISETPLAWSFSDADGSAQIPSGYDYYTLFINTSHTYANNESDKKLDTLERNFKRFGDSIGDRNLAVWVNEPGSKSLSVARGKYYADLLSSWPGVSLEYSDGPFVVITDLHPSKFTVPKGESPDDPIVISISLGDITAARTIEVLNYVESRIRRDDVSPTKTRLNVWWVRLAGYWDETEFRDFMKDVTIALIK